MSIDEILTKQRIEVLEKLMPEIEGSMNLYEYERAALIAALDALKENGRLEAELKKYKSFYERIEGLPDCNTCADKWCCTKCPAPGENTRINCPLWREKITP